ncbi:hypothetical protein ANN_19999 [Periplaneta americana]|uniref:Uncharacterized protein n=1 Tax=Periplaneta americana TaxID=6978 RepID=A0ABQ8SBT2_PERAM|nr:hypothetical protein ANN_19999 [Periplaneta americana]
MENFKETHIQSHKLTAAVASSEINSTEYSVFQKYVAFSIEEKAYIIEVYFHTDMKDDYGNWNYNITECEQQFLFSFSQIPDYIITEYFRRNVINLVDKFRATECTERKKSIGKIAYYNPAALLNTEKQNLHKAFKNTFLASEHYMMDEWSGEKSLRYRDLNSGFQLYVLTLIQPHQIPIPISD